MQLIYLTSDRLISVISVISVDHGCRSMYINAFVESVLAALGF